jgi:threonine/homoserine/homoserine lactone efflux protein
MVLAAVGVAELIAAAPLALATLRWAGVAFLVYLGWQAWIGAHEPSPERGDGFDHAPFWRGFIANILNPKALVFYVALLPGFIAPDRAPFWAQALMLGLAHLLVSVFVHVGIVIAAARAGELLAESSRIVVLRRVLAIGIILVAAWLAWDTRS